MIALDSRLFSLSPNVAGRGCFRGGVVARLSGDFGLRSALRTVSARTFECNPSVPTEQFWRVPSRLINQSDIIWFNIHSHVQEAMNLYEIAWSYHSLIRLALFSTSPRLHIATPRTLQNPANSRRSLRQHQSHSHPLSGRRGHQIFEKRTHFCSGAL